MENNGIDPITGLEYGKSVQIDFNSGKSYLPGGDAVGRFQNLNEADKGLAFGENQQDVRAYNQGDWQAFFNGLGQIVPTLAGETVSGVGYLFDMVGGSEQSFGNMLTDFGDSITQKGQDFMPVYSSRENQNGFKPFNGEWWGSNVSSIASSLAMLVPSAGIGAISSRLLNTTSKASKAFKALEAGSTANRMGSVVAASLASRHIEGMMEAKDTHEYAYRQALNNGNTHADAIKLANESAADHYKLNYLNIGTDLLQYALLGGLFKVGPKVKPKAGTNIATQGVSEAFEESLQFVLAEEAKHKVDTGLGLKEDNKFSQRFGDYISDPQLWTSAFWGAAGGITFGSPIGKMLYKAAQPKIKAAFNTLEKAASKEITTADSGVEIVSNMVDNAVDSESLTKHIDGINSMIELSQQEDSGLDINKLTEYRSDLEFAKQQFEALSQADISLDLVKEKVKAATNDRIYNRKVSEIESDIDTIIKSDTKLSPEEAELKKLQIDKEAYESVTVDPVYDSILNRLKTNKLKEIDSRIKELKESGTKSKPSTTETAAKNKAKDKVKTEVSAEIEREKAAKLNQKNAEKKVKEDKDKQKEQDKLIYEATLREKAKEIDNPQQLEQLAVTEQRNDPTRAYSIADVVREAYNNKVEEESINRPSKEDSNDRWKAFYETNPFTLNKHLTQLGVNNIEELLKLREEKLNEILDQDQIDEKLNNIEKKEVTETPDVIIKPYIERVDEESPLAQDTVKYEETESNALATQTHDAATYRVDDNHKVIYYGIDRSPESVGDSPYDVSPEPTGTKFKTLRKDGELVKSELNNQPASIIDEDFIRSGYVKEGDIVYFEIDPNNKYNQSINGNINKMRVIVVAEDSNGKRQPIGILKASNRNKSAPNFKMLEEIRSKVVFEYLQEKPTEVFRSTFSSTIDRIYGGRFNTVNRRTSPLNVLKEGQPLHLGVGYHTTSKQGEIIVKGPTRINVNQQEVGIDPELNSFNVKDGAVYMIVPALSGINVPVRLFTKPIGKHLKLRREVIRLISTVNKKNQEEVRRKVREIIRYKKEDGGKIYPDFNANLQDKVKPKVITDPTTLIPGDIIIFANNVYTVEGIDPDGAVNVGNQYITPDFFKAGEVREHFATHYYKFMNFDNVPLQINVKKINTGDYNNQIADRLETDLAAYQHFHSPKFVIGPVKDRLEAPVKPIKKEEVEEAPAPVPVEQDESLDDIDLGDLTGGTGSITVDVDNQETGPRTLRERLQYVVDNLLTDNEKAKASDIEFIETQYANLLREDPVQRGYKTLIKKINRKLNSIDNIYSETNIDGNKDPKLSTKSDNPYTLWNKEQELAWFNKNFPNVPITVLEDLKEIHAKGENAWGMFYNAAVYIANNAKEGTTYHEAFHVVFNLFLNDNQRKEVLDEASIRYGKELSSDQLEEKLAEEFEVFELARNSSTVTGKIKAFFLRISDFFKRILGKSSVIETLFSKIGRGKFKEFVPVKGKQFEPKLKRIEGLTPVQRRDRVNISLNMLDRVIEEIARNKKGNIIDYYKQAITDDPNTNLITATGKVNGINSVYRYVKASTNQIKKGLPVNQHSDYDKHVKVFLESIRTPEGGFGPLYEDIVLALNTRGIIVNKYKIQAKNNPSNELGDKVEIDRDVETKQAWAIKATDISVYEKIGPKLRRFFNNVPVIKNKIINDDGTVSYEFVKDDLGLTKYRSPNQLYQEIQEVAGDSIDINHMLDKLERRAAVDSTFYKIMSEADESLINELFLHVGQKIKPLFYSVVPKYIGSDTKALTVIESNRNNRTSSIINNLLNSWSDPSQNRTLNADGSINKEKAVKALGAFREELNAMVAAIKAKRPFNRDKIYRIIKAAGYNVNRDAFFKVPLRQLAIALKTTGGKTKEGLENVFLNVSKGLDPFIGDTKGLRIFSGIVGQYYPKYLQDSHTKPTGGTVHEWIDASFMSRQTLEFKHRHQDKIDFYSSDPYYQGHPFLDNLKDPRFRDSLEIVLHTSTRDFGRSTSKEYTDFSDKDMYTTILAYYHNGSSKNSEMVIPFPVLSDSSVLAGLKLPKVDNVDKAVNILYKLASAEYARTLTGTSSFKFKKGKEKFLTKFNFLQEHVNNWDSVKVKESIKDYMFNATRENIAKLKTLDIIKGNNDNLSLAGLDNRIIDVPGFIELATYNFAIGQAYLTDMYHGDLSYYTSFNQDNIPSFGNFYKRSKEVWSPGSFGIQRKFKNKTYKVKVKDDSTYKDENLIKKIEELVGKDAAKAFSKGADETDGGSYIDIYRFKQQQEALQNWDNSKEEAYQRLLKGGSNFYDINTVFQPNKPFYFAHQRDNSGIIYPLQVKNSEYVILPSMAKYGKVFKQDLESMGYRFGKDGNVSFDQEGRDKNEKYFDQIIFRSNIKVGENLDSDVLVLDNANWRKQQEVPAHHEDTTGLFGIQLMKLITADIDPNDKERMDLVEVYNDSIIRDINESFSDVIGKMSTMSEILEKIREEVISRNLGSQYLEALEEIAGDPVLPLYHPLHAYRVESLLNSIFKNKVTNQEFNSGGTFVNVSSYGFDKKPRIIFNENGGIDHFEAYITPNSKDLLLFTDEDGFIDVDKLPDKVREGFMYRIPTEAKYSMAKIKVIGYLPSEAGGAIVLPPEITLIAGLDFDIDKMFGFFYNKKLKLKQGELSKLLSTEYGKQVDESDINKIFRNPEDSRQEEIRDNIAELILNNRELATFEVIPSNMETKEGRDNLRLDIIGQLWSHPDSTKHILNPGGFQKIEKTTDRIKEVKGLNIIENPLTMKTDVSMVKRMTSSAALIGIAAVPSSVRPLLQQSNVRLVYPFKFKDSKGNVKEYSELNNIKDREGNFISRNFSENLAAFVDTLKNPQAEFYNMNTYTSDVFFGLLHAGIDLETAMYFISQPIVVRFTERYFNNGGTKQAESKVIKQYKEEGFDVSKISGRSAAYPFSKQELLDNLKSSTPEFQRNVLQTFFKYKIVSKDIGSLIRAIKMGDKGAGPTLSQNIQNIQMVEDINFDYIEGANEVLNKETYLKSFYDKGIVDATNHIVEVAKLPDPSKGAIKKILDVFNYMFKPKGNVLSQKEIEHIYRSFIDYIVAGFGIYRDNYNLVDNLPDILENYQKTNSKYDPFIKRLNVVLDKTSKKKYIEFKGFTGSDPNVINMIRETWSDMLVTGNDLEKSLATGLAIYSFYVSGFRVSPIGFSNLQPVNFFDGLQDENGDTFNMYLREMVQDIQNVEALEGTVYQPFIRQYIRNHFRSLSLVPSAVIDEDFSNIDTVRLDANKVPTHITVSAPEFIISEGEMTEYVPYIKHRKDNKTYLYKRIGAGSYSRVSGLGLFGTSPAILRIVEYQFGQDVVNSEYSPNETVDIPRDVPNDVVEDNPLDDQCNKSNK